MNGETEGKRQLWKALRDNMADLTTGAFKLAYTLIDFATWKDGRWIAWPSYQAIQEKAGSGFTCRRATSKYLKELEAAGMVERQRRRGSNIYTLLPNERKTTEPAGADVPQVLVADVPQEAGADVPQVGLESCSCATPNSCSCATSTSIRCATTLTSTALTSSSELSSLSPTAPKNPSHADDSDGKIESKPRQKRKRDTSAVEADVDAVLAAYAKLKPPALDTSRSRAKKHIRKLLQKYPLDHLLVSVQNYQHHCEMGKIKKQFRWACGNFFGRHEDYLDYLPGQYVPVEAVEDKIDDSELVKPWLAIPEADRMIIAEKAAQPDNW